MMFIRYCCVFEGGFSVRVVSGHRSKMFIEGVSINVVMVSIWLGVVCTSDFVDAAPHFFTASFVERLLLMINVLMRLVRDTA